MELVRNKVPQILYAELIEEDVVAFAKSGDSKAEEYLIKKYKKILSAQRADPILIGADREDIIQEGMIGLFKAIRDFQPDKMTSFRFFAELCITRQIITAIKTATRQKHIPLNSYVSLNKPVFDDESERTLLDIMTGKKVMDPEKLFISKEQVSYIEMTIGQVLSALEIEVLNAYLDGRSYVEIAAELDRPVKSIDNALQRVKRKLEKSLESRTS